MNKRLILLAGSAAALVLLLAAYWLHFRPAADEAGRRVRRPIAPGTEQPAEFAGMQADPGKKLRIVQYTRDHRLQAVYLAESWKKVGEKIHLQDPRVEWYLRGGELVRIRAREGRVTAQEVAGKVKVREGELVGDVWIVLDRSTDPSRLPLETRPEDSVRIHVDEVRFDNDLLTIDSDSYVSLFAREADILGKGLRLAWSEGPRQLRELRIRRGEYMCIREGQERFVSDVLLPGGIQPDRAPTTAPAESGALPRAPAGGGAGPLPLALMASALAATPTPPASAPASMPATVPASMPATAPASMPATAPASMPAAGADDRPPVVPETYVAVLTGDVRVRSGARRVRGADELKLVFDFTPPQRLRAPATRPVDAPAAPPTPTLPHRPGPRTRPADRPATAPPAEAPRAAEPLFVTWSGPLVITPFRSRRRIPPPQEVPKRFDVSGRGRRVELTDGGTRAVCERFEVHSRLKARQPGDAEQRRGKLTVATGELAGSNTRPVELSLPSGERVSARRVRFDRDSGLVNLDGAGTMHLPGGGQLGRDKTPAEARRRQGLDVAWKKEVELSFGEQGIETEAGRQRRDYLRSADFAGAVHVRQGRMQDLQADRLEVKFHEPTGPEDPVNRAASLHAAGGVHLADAETGDFIKSHTLDVEMGAGPEGGTVPAKAVARGKVSARQQDTDIAADSLKVTFASRRDKKTRRVRVRPKRLEAAGKVKITDRSDPDRTVVAEADELLTDLDARTATLRGDLARVAQTYRLTPAKKDQKGRTERNAVEGEEIVLDQKGESAKVNGRGRLRFHSDTDISGTRAEKPRPVEITWTDGMEFSGKKRTAAVIGDVRLATAGDTMECQKMRVRFAPRPAGPATGPATRPAARDQAARFRAERIATVIAEKDVRLESVRTDPKGFLLRRVLLRSPNKVQYEAAAEKLDCFGPGTLSVEDYRPPVKRAAGAASDVLLSGGIPRPSQSAFDWKESMKMDQKERVVRLAGGVKMAHRSGEKVLLSKKLKVPPWGKLPKGRKTMMVCDRMLARFDPPDDKPDDRADSLGGPKVGDLALFDARGDENDVNLVDGPRQVLCRRVLYQRARDLAIIWGSLPGEPLKDAVLYHEDKERGTLNSWKSPKLIWHRQTNRIEAKDVEVRGGR